MRLDGRAYRPKRAEEAIAAGVFMCPKDRGTNAVVHDFDITRNLTVPFLPRHSAFSFLKPGSERATARKIIGDLGIVCQGPTDGIATLSGGNQQKVMVGRWLSEPSSVLVLDEPFQGVDIRARRDIGRHIRETAGDRATIVFVAELDEALEIADRILVISEGALAGDHVNRDVDVPAILSQVSGSRAGGTAHAD